jgi:hypothetical protein
MTIGEFIETLPRKHALSEEERGAITVGIYFTKARDEYGIPLICFCDPSMVSKFAQLLRTAGYRGDIPLSP